MRTKVTYIISNINKALAFEWIAEGLDDSRYDLSFVLLSPEKPFLYDWLEKKNIPVHYIKYKGKKSVFRSIIRIYKLLAELQSEVVHTHLFDANITGLLAAKLKGVKRRIYTRHHSLFHHHYFPNAVKWDRLCNWLSTDIVAISENVKQVLLEKEGVHKNKIHLIHHGFKLEDFQEPDARKLGELKKKYKITEGNYPVVGVISRYLKLKGIQYIVPAFKELLLDYPNAKLILANASGADAVYVRKLLLEQLEESNYLEIEFEPELFALYQLFDAFVHVPIDSGIEAFGQTYVEALAAGIPSVFTLSGVASEFVVDQKNALVVDFCDSKGIYKAIKHYLSDENFKNSIVEQGREDVKSFGVKRYLRNLEKLYDQNQERA